MDLDCANFPGIYCGRGFIRIMSVYKTDCEEKHMVKGHAMNHSARQAVLYLLIVSNALSRSNAQLSSGSGIDSPLGDDECDRVSLSEPLVYYTAVQDTLFVSIKLD